MAAYDYSAGFGLINNAIGALGKKFETERQRQTLAELGRSLTGATPDYTSAAQRAFATGQSDLGLGLLKLGQTQQERQALTAGLAAWSDPDSPASVAAPSTGGTAPAANIPLVQGGDRSQPRGIRNNNPGNIEAGNFTSGLPGFKGSDGRFAVFESPEQGIVAADRLLQSYANRGLNTVAGIVNRWAPPSENNTGAYAASVARDLGVDPNQPLDMSNPQVRQKLITAKIKVENGRQPYGDDVFARAYGGGGVPAPTPVVAGGPLPPPGAQVAQSIAGDDPAKLRADAEYYAQSNPEASRQFLARAEAAEAGGNRPVQLAQAPAAPGSPVADIPAQGAAPAQGFVVPGGSAPASIANDPKVRLWQQRLASPLAVQNEGVRRIAERNLEIATKDAERRYNEGKAPESVREWQWARQNGYTTAKSPVEYAKERSDATSQRQTPVEKVGEFTDAADKLGLVGEERKFYIANGRVPTASEKVTEGQANAALYADRMKEAEAILLRPEVSSASASSVQRGLAQIPAVGNRLVSTEFQQADQAKRNFINATLRRESGAVISPSEFENAEKQYFPQPGDGKEVLEQKARNRQTAIEGVSNAAGPSYAKRQGGKSEAPPVQGARQAPDGNYYVPDPNRPGKYLMVQP